jgi:hypothetical protein
VQRNLIKFGKTAGFSNGISLVLVAIIISKIVGYVLGPVVLFVALIYISALYIPSKYPTQRIAISALLFIGMSPIYLIVRGLLPRGALTNWDLQIYSLGYLLVLFFAAKLSENKSITKLDLFDRRYLKLTLSSLVGFFLALIVELVLKSRSVGDSVAWIASGDSKNHFVNGVTLTELGYLNPQTFLVQPSSSPSYLSLVLSQLSSGVDNAVELMPELMQSYALVWVILIGVLGIAFAAITELIWNHLNSGTKQVPIHLLAVSSLIPTFSVILGPALYDGFFSAIFGITAVVVLTSWFLEVSGEVRLAVSNWFVGLFIFASSVTAWMFVAPVTALLLLLGIRNSLRKALRNTRYLDGSIFASCVLLVVVLHEFAFVQSLIYKAKLSLTASGAVNAPNPNYFFLVLAFILIGGLLLITKIGQIGKYFGQIVAIQVLGLLAFKSFSNLGIFDWNYYLTKYQWIMLASLIGLLFAVSISVLAVLLSNNRQNYLIGLGLAVFVVFTISETVVATNRVWEKIWIGWENPRSLVMNEALKQEIDRENPTMFFHYGYAGDSKLANFWLNAFSNPVDPIKGWNYTIDTTGDPRQLCDVNAYYPTVTVVTSDSMLEQELLQLCPSEIFEVKLQAPIL